MIGPIYYRWQELVFIKTQVNYFVFCFRNILPGIVYMGIISLPYMIGRQFTWSQMLYKFIIVDRRTQMYTQGCILINALDYDLYNICRSTFTTLLINAMQTEFRAHVRGAANSLSMQINLHFAGVRSDKGGLWGADAWPTHLSLMWGNFLINCLRKNQLKLIWAQLKISNMFVL